MFNLFKTELFVLSGSSDSFFVVLNQAQLCLKKTYKIANDKNNIIMKNKYKIESLH